jgi:3-methyl-2-oxobutanoate hydroxymethyltransferase
MSKITAPSIKAMKGSSKIVALTAYDFTTAGLVDEAGVHLVLVGDSLAMCMLGHDTTLPVTMDEMLHHAAAVSRGVTNALVVADMPFMSYHVSPKQAVENAGRFIKEADADAVKIEGGALRASTVAKLVENDIPTLAHIGLTPQSIKAMGGYKVQGKASGDAERLLTDAKVLEQAGAFGIVLECVPADLGAELTKSVSIPTIGIGAGPDCDGQILVIHDMLGMHPQGTRKLKFVKQYADLGTATTDAIKAYKQEVESGAFPSEEHGF